MNVIAAVSLIAVIVSPNSGPNSSQQNTPISPFDAMAQESYSGVSINDIVPCEVVNPVGGSSVADDAARRADKWLRKQRESAAFYSPPKSDGFGGFGGSGYRGATGILPPSAYHNGRGRGDGHGKPPCVPEVSTTLTLAAGGLGLFYTRRRLKISQN